MYFFIFLYFKLVQELPKQTEAIKEVKKKLLGLTSKTSMLRRYQLQLLQACTVLYYNNNNAILIPTTRWYKLYMQHSHWLEPNMRKGRYDRGRRITDTDVEGKWNTKQWQKLLKGDSYHHHQYLEGVKLRELPRGEMIQTRTTTKNEFPLFLVLW